VIFSCEVGFSYGRAAAEDRTDPGWHVYEPGRASSREYYWPHRFVSSVPYATAVRLPPWMPLLAASLTTAFLLRLSRRRLSGSLCPHGGYDLTGNVSGRCPECAAPIARESPHGR
jgi:hypothetical protein